MITEIADVRVLADRVDEFPAAVAQAMHLVAATPGFRGLRLTRSVESPTCFVLFVDWDSVEAHVEGFRGSDNFRLWREEVGPYFEAEPYVEHVETVVELPATVAPAASIAS